ncbi:MAG: peptide-methionine (S)-S-oxide reductase, partial [Planctomycetaceae bacterium]
GYTGGTKDKPTYKEVCTGTTGHAESVEILFDPAKVSYEKLARMFFEIHDPTQMNRQGPDTGSQYRSAVFYTTDEQKKTAESLIAILRQRGYKVVTEVKPASTFWAAEEYHQDYITKHPGMTCHVPVNRFGPETQQAGKR